MVDFYTKEERDFYLQCAIAAMQGLQESGKKISLVSDLFSKETAKMACELPLPEERGFLFQRPSLHQGPTCCIG